MASIELVMETTVKCYCCGLTEECTQQYVDRVRQRYQGRWICGLCVEAVKEEALKSEATDDEQEALERHMNFRSSSPSNKPTLDFIIAMKHLLFRSLSSPRKQPLTTLPPLGRSQTYFSTITATTQPEEPQPHTTRINVQAGETS